MRRARATGDYQDVLRAEAAARKSLDNRGAHNTARAPGARCLASLASTASATRSASRRSSASATCRTLPFRASRRRDPDGARPLRSMRARASRPWPANTSDLSVAPRLARWAELEGHPDSAYRLMNAALLAVRRSPRCAGASRRRGSGCASATLQFRRGKIDEAASDYQRGLAAHAGRLSAARGDGEARGARGTSGRARSTTASARSR